MLLNKTTEFTEEIIKTDSFSFTRKYFSVCSAVNCIIRTNLEADISIL